MGSCAEKGVGDDSFGLDSRLIRRMIRRNVSNKSSRDFNGTGKNVAAATKDVNAIDDDLDYDYVTFFNRKCSGIPGYVDLHGDHYDDINFDITNVDKSSDGGLANKSADDGNSEANKCPTDENADACDVFIDPEYKLFLDNSSVRTHDIFLCLGNEVIAYGQIDDVGESSCLKKTCDSRPVDAEAKRSSKSFHKRRRMSVVGNRNNRDNLVGPMDNHMQATESSKSKSESSNKEGNNSAIELADNDPEYNLVLNSMAVDSTYGESVAGLFKKVKYSQDEKNKSDAEVLQSNKREKPGVKLGDLSPQCDLSSSVAVNGRSKESRTKHCNEVGCGEDEKNESDAEVTILEWDPSSGGEHTPFVSSKSYDVFVDDHKIPNSGRKVSSEYKEDLIKYLKKPYAKNEYCQLMKEVSRRKPVDRDMDLRSGTKPFATQVMGKSYLDCHKDLNSKIKEAKLNRLKVLNILRGFFFWLQNITREGAFRPWMDPSVLDITPDGQLF